MQNGRGIPNFYIYKYLLQHPGILHCLNVQK